MATNETNTTDTGNDQAIGTAVIVSGLVEVASPDGATRLLQVNGLVFANETIITGNTGKVSIIFNDAAETQLDLGRMSEVVLDEDVYPSDQAVDLADVVSEVEQLQEALLQGDPTQDLPAPAAGPAAVGTGARGGGHPTAVFALTGEEVTPTSGAETIGISRDFLEPERPIGEQEEIGEVAAIIPPGDDTEIKTVNYFPEAGDYSSVIDEANFLDGTEPVSTPQIVTGDLTTLGIDFGGDGPGYITIGGQSIAIDNLNGTADDFITVSGTYGSLQMWDNGSWTYTITTNIDHPLPNLTGGNDSLPDLFAFTVFDSNGDSATGTLTINIWDDGPEAGDVILTRVVEEEALDNYLSVGNPDESDGPEDSDFNSIYQNDAAQVSGSLIPFVTTGADNPGTFIWGSLADLPSLSSQGGEIVYEINANGTTLEAWVHDGKPARISPDFDGNDGDRLIFTLDLQPDGSYTFTLLDQLDHVTADGENSALQLWGPAGGSVEHLDFSTAILVIDTDLDHSNLAPGGLIFLIVDDIPELVEEAHATATVFEDGLDSIVGDFSDGIGGGDTDATIMLSNLVKVGTDEELTYSLLDNLAYQPTALTSGGKPVTYSVVGNVLTAATADNIVFTFTIIDTATGEASFELVDQLDHSPGIQGTDAEILTISDLGRFIQATDADGDSVNFTGTLVINIENDVPETGTPQYAILANEAGNNLVANLAIEIGADEPGTEMTLNPFYQGEIVLDGAAVRNNEGDVLTYQGNPLTWQQNSSGSWTAVVQDSAASHLMAPPIPVFTVSLEEITPGVYTGNYTVELYEELDGHLITEEFALAPPYGPPSPALVLTEGDLTMTFTGINPSPDGSDDLVNWNAQGIGVGNTFVNEDVNGDEILTASFSDSSTGEAILVRSATFGIDHNDEFQQGSGTPPEVVNWTAYDEQGTIVGEGILEGEMQGSTWQWDQEITIDSSNTVGDFSSVTFTAETSNAEGIRVVPIEVTYDEEADHTLTFVVDGEDYDGDTFDQQSFNVTFDGEGDIEGTNADEVIVGSSGDDVIFGGEGDDVIFGDTGNDVIYGEEGDDTLLGGTEEVPPAPDEEGNDIISGDEGADTFDTSEENAGEVLDYEPDPPPVGEDDELADLVPPVTP